jgi:hypothetical protein
MMRNVMAAAAALVVAGSTWAAATKAPAPMSEAAYEASQARIAADFKAEREACDRVRGHARDLCRAQSKGRKNTARAELQARYEPSPEADQQLKNARAEAKYALARVRCDALKGNAEDRCRQEAKGALEAAIRQAKVEKVEETGGIFRRQAAESRGSRGGKS